jgi:hypothetical protein
MGVKTDWDGVFARLTAMVEDSDREYSLTGMFEPADKDASEPDFDVDGMAKELGIPANLLAAWCSFIEQARQADWP